MVLFNIIEFVVLKILVQFCFHEKNVCLHVTVYISKVLKNVPSNVTLVFDVISERVNGLCNPI